MTTHRFERITATARRRVTCPVCGKRRTVSRTFGQTVNPFHSAVKALGPGFPDAAYRRAVRESVNAEAEAWHPTGPRVSIHEKCWDAWKKATDDDES